MHSAGETLFTLSTYVGAFTIFAKIEIGTQCRWDDRHKVQVSPCSFSPPAWRPSPTCAKTEIGTQCRWDLYSLHLHGGLWNSVLFCHGWDEHSADETLFETLFTLSMCADTFTAVSSFARDGHTVQVRPNGVPYSVNNLAIVCLSPTLRMTWLLWVCPLHSEWPGYCVSVPDTPNELAIVCLSPTLPMTWLLCVCPLHSQWTGYCVSVPYIPNELAVVCLSPTLPMNWLLCVCPLQSEWPGYCVSVPYTPNDLAVVCLSPTSLPPTLWMTWLLCFCPLH